MPTTPAPDVEKKPDQLALEIGKQIDRALARKGMSVSKLHQETGISRTVLQGYLKGRYKPGARELRLLSLALDCSPNLLLFGRENPREHTYLDSIVGDADKAKSTAKMAVLISLLTLEEQRAVVTLASLIAEQRVGGRAKLVEALRATEAVFESLEERGPTLEQRATQLIGSEELDSITKKLEHEFGRGETPSPPSAQRAKPAKKPGK
ncbi:MAG: hypothetical protein Tsb007_37180 [Rhizobacter sp.]